SPKTRTQDDSVSLRLYPSNSNWQEPMAILAGLRLGPYEILSAIGAGGMGEVYRGGLLSGSAIATKDLRPEACVVGCEPRNANDTARSVAAGHIEPAPKTRT